MDLDESSSGGTEERTRSRSLRKGEMKAVSVITPASRNSLASLANAADVFRPVGVRESEIGAKPVPDVVAVEDEGATATPMQRFLDGMREGRLAGAGESGEPDDDALVSVESFALFASDRGGVPDDIVRVRHAAWVGMKVNEG
jgi:hypothetical protein